MMPNDRTSRVLDEFAAVTRAAPRPDSPAARVVVRNRLPVATLSAASLVVVTVAVAAIVLGRPGPAPVAGSSAQPSPSASAIASAATATSPSASAEPAIGPCDPAELTASISVWEGAAGQRIAHVELTSRATRDCLIDPVARPQLVDGGGSILIDGIAGTPGKDLVLAPGGTLTTLVSAGNYCGPDPRAPVGVAFLWADGRRLVAAPVNPADATVPPCNGAGAQATISMHPWAR